MFIRYRPRLEPPGGTFRCEVLQGFSFLTDDELQVVIREVCHGPHCKTGSPALTYIQASEKFQGTAYNLLTFNCNHFTSYLCEKLTARPAPRWLNRAASIGVALPCVVPREWIAPPDHDTADGELLDEDEEDERAAMLRNQSQNNLHLTDSQDMYSTDEETERSRSRSKGKRSTSTIDIGRPRRSSVRDTSGREIPVSERAPIHGRS